MCDDPQTKDGKQFACRRCNACIAARRNGWVARAMAEKTQWRQPFCLSLTYNEDTQRSRDGARFFQYFDVWEWLKRLRLAIEDKWPGEKIRFIVAGEQGDRERRCHWHVIVYTNVDLTQLGVITGMKGRKKVRLTQRADIMTTTYPKRERRVDWSLWGMGFVTFQDMDLGSAHYVLDYCLKDQFTEEKSRGTMRVHRSENFATGLFRMSKYPPIGQVWLDEQIQALRNSRAVLPALKLAVPEYPGYWSPAGQQRKQLLDAMRYINQQIRAETGADAPQWRALVASVSKFEAQKDRLCGKDEENPESDNFADPARSFELQLEEKRHQQHLAEIRLKCGGKLPCDECLLALSKDELASLGVAAGYDEGRPGFVIGGSAYEVAVRQHQRGPGAHPLCLLRGSKDRVAAFPASGL